MKEKKESKPRNKELYDYIVANFVESETPMTAKEIAEAKGFSKSYIEYFMHKYNLKKNIYNTKEVKLIKSMYELGYTYKEMGEALHVTECGIFIRVKLLKERGVLGERGKKFKRENTRN